jgi:hypothetical protein
MSRQVNMHLTDDEYALLKRRAEGHGKSPGGFAKGLLMAQLARTEIANEAPKADAAQ